VVLEDKPGNIDLQFVKMNDFFEIDASRATLWYQPGVDL